MASDSDTPTEMYSPGPNDITTVPHYTVTTWSWDNWDDVPREDRHLTLSVRIADEMIHHHYNDIADGYYKVYSYDMMARQEGLEMIEQALQGIERMFANGYFQCLGRDGMRISIAVYLLRQFVNGNILNWTSDESRLRSMSLLNRIIRELQSICAEIFTGEIYRVVPTDR